MSLIACSTCNELKYASCFHKCKSHKLGYYPICKDCRRPKSKAYRDKCGDKIRAKWRETYKQNPTAHKENAKRYQAENWERRKAYWRAWTKKNPGKANAHTAARYAARTRAVPPWLTKQHRKEIREIYELAKDLQWLSKEPLHVDHIEPLRGKISCGLHVPWNLQIIPASKNLAKSNSLGAR